MKTKEELIAEMDAAEDAMFAANDAVREGVKPGQVEANRKLMADADRAKEVYTEACKAVRKAGR